MKFRKILFAIIIIITITLASSIPVSAIDFDAEEKYNSVFVISSGQALGSGFAIGENCVVTNAHVIDNQNSIILTGYNGNKYPASLIGFDDNKDIAILAVDNVTFVPLTIATVKNAGDDVYAIGAPKSMAYTLTKGVVSAKERKVGTQTYIQTDAAINEGNSGGPLIDANGNAIGMNTLKMIDSEGIGLAIPMNVVSEFVKSLNIKTDKNGNVSEKISGTTSGNYNTPTESNSNNSSSDNNSNNNNNKTPGSATTSKKITGTKILFIVLCASVLLNAVLTILLILSKRKIPPANYDPRERTDFEIDILE